MSSQKCFISYSWESDNHKSWVRQLASDLQRNGVYVLLDQWDLKLGADITNYMESSIRESDFVILVCTPSFAKKANEGKGGVGYEKSIVTGEIFYNSAIETKFVPILKNGSPEESLPSYLKSRLFVDFREERLYQASLTELLRHFFKSPEFERPPLGKRPNLETKSDIISSHKSKEGTQRPTAKQGGFDLTKFRDLVGYASQSEEYGGLGYSKDDAIAWAQNNLNIDLIKFRDLVEYASQSEEYGGLGYSMDDATAWALNNLNLDLGKFRDLVGYASQSEEYGGLGYSMDDAIAWAIKKL